jgi:hypothetical protein
MPVSNVLVFAAHGRDASVVGDLRVDVVGAPWRIVPGVVPSVFAVTARVIVGGVESTLATLPLV